MSNTVDVYISQLRKKIDPGSTQKLIQTNPWHRIRLAGRLNGRRNMRRFSFLQTVSARLTLLNVVVLALVLLFLGGILRAVVSVNLIASIDRDLENRARRHQDFWAHLPARPATGTPKDGKASVNREKPPPVPSASQVSPKVSRWRTPVLERVFDLNGRQIWPPDEPEHPWDCAAFVLATGGNEKLSTVFDGAESVRVFSAPLRNKSGEISGVVQVGASLTGVDGLLANLNKTLLTLAPVAMLISGLGGLALTRWMHRPLRQVNHAIALMSAEDLSRRLVVGGQDEFSILAKNFNAMLSRLEESFEQQRRFTADASHELRTPLTVIKVYSSRGLSDPESTERQRQAWGATDRAATLMNAIVQDLLLLARSDAGQLTPSLQPTPVWADMEAAIEAVHTEGGAPIFNTLPRHLMVYGDGILLTRVFTNLLKNALRHTLPEGTISIKAETKGDLVVVAITDTGTGIPAADLPHVLERFYRVDAARSRAGGGTGLGLAICQSLVNAQGGQLEIDSVLGEGTTVRVALCLAEAGNSLRSSSS